MKIHYKSGLLLKISCIAIPPILILFFFRLIIIYDNNKVTPSKVSILIDESNQWVKHNIADKINGHSVSLATADINQDAKTDVLISLGIRNTPKPTDGVWWFEAPNWKLYRISAPALPIRWSLSLTTGDIDNDGDLDVVALSFDDSNVYLSINPLAQGGDINKPWKTIKILKSPGIHRDGERVELVDIDQDGYKDVLFARGRPFEVRILFNPSGNPNGEWSNTLVGLHGGSDAHSVSYKDIDLDGDLDIVTASGDQTWLGSVFWYEHPDNQPHKGQWVRHLVSGGKVMNRLANLIPYDGLTGRLIRGLGAANYGGLQIDDIDNDGRPDILVSEAHGRPGNIIWYKNPTPSGREWKKSLIDKQNFPHGTLAVDVNGDNVQEFWTPDGSIDVKNKIGGIVYYKLINAQKNEWSKHIVAFSPAVGGQSYAVDMDGDGDMDIVATADHSMLTKDSIVWWENRLNQSM